MCLSPSCSFFNCTIMMFYFEGFWLWWSRSKEVQLRFWHGYLRLWLDGFSWKWRPDPLNRGYSFYLRVYFELCCLIQDVRKCCCLVSDSGFCYQHFFSQSVSGFQVDADHVAQNQIYRYRSGYFDVLFISYLFWVYNQHISSIFLRFVLAVLTYAFK